jgi:hypothetical protein
LLEFGHLGGSLGVSRCLRMVHISTLLPGVRTGLLRAVLSRPASMARIMDATEAGWRGRGGHAALGGWISTTIPGADTGGVADLISGRHFRLTCASGSYRVPESELRGGM